MVENSFAGQWISSFNSEVDRYLLDLDEDGDHLNGYAYLFESNHELPIIISELKLIKNVKDISQTLKIKPYAINPITNLAILSEVEFRQLYPNISIPDEVDATLTFRNDKKGNQVLDVVWSHPERNDKFSITRKPLELNKSNIKSRNDIKSWDDFKRYAFSEDAKGKIFRGQSSNWKLKTSFHRTNRTDMWKYLNRDIPQLAIHFSANTNFLYDNTNPAHLAAILSTAQHHGYPTPLLDWTSSPFVAAYFAFCNIKEEDISGDKDGKVRIIIFKSAEWEMKISQSNDLRIRYPHFSIVPLLSVNNPRYIPQQSIFSLCNVEDIEEYIQYQSNILSIEFIEAIDLPKSYYKEILKDLEKIGISYGTLFPGLDGVCDTLRRRNFEI